MAFEQLSILRELADTLLDDDRNPLNEEWLNFVTPEEKDKHLLVGTIGAILRAWVRVDEVAQRALILTGLNIDDSVDFYDALEILGDEDGYTVEVKSVEVH